MSTLWLTRSWWRGQGLKCLLTLSTFAVNFHKCWLSLLKGLDDISLHLLGHSRKAGSLPRTSWHNFLEDWRVDSVRLALGIAKKQRGWAFNWTSRLFGVHLNASLRID